MDRVTLRHEYSGFPLQVIIPPVLHTFLSPYFMLTISPKRVSTPCRKIQTDGLVTPKEWNFGLVYCSVCRSQWPRALRHEPSSPAQTLKSCVRIPLEAWMSVCVYSVFVLSCVCSRLATGWSPVQGVLPTVYKIKKLTWNGVPRLPYTSEGAIGVK
jgi:hypothetical protein